MSKQEFYGLIEGVIEAEPGTIEGDEALANFPSWDSMAIIGFIAALDRALGVTLPVKSLLAAKTANDIAALLGDKVSA